MNYAWNWDIFLEPAPDGSASYLMMMLNGAQATLVLAGTAWLIALFSGVPVGIARYVGGAWGAIGRAWVEIFRNIPLLVQMFLWYFVFPELLPQGMSTAIKQSPYGSFVLGTIALGCYTSARIAEQVRSGLGAIPPGQMMAGKALGLRGPQVFRHVLMPRVGRLLMPILTSESISVVKNSAVALTIGVAELTAQARAMQEYSFQVFEAFIFATLGYLAINLLIIVIMGAIERRFAVPGLGKDAHSAGKAA